MSFGVPKLAPALAEAGSQMLAARSIRGISLACLVRRQPAVGGRSRKARAGQALA
jgi:hypothetical protein